MANPNPSQSTRFGQPGGNIPGKTAEHRRMEIEAAEKAAAIQLRMVEAVTKYLDVAAAAEEDDVGPFAGVGATIAHIKTDILRLLKDSQDRGFGAPTNSVNVGGQPGNPLDVRRIEIVPGVMPSGPDDEA